MRVQVVDPSAYTPPYDHALCAALARQGVDVELVTSRFAYGAVPAPDGFAQREFFYRHVLGAPGSWLRRGSKLAVHLPDMVRYRAHAAAADVVHFQWLTLPWLDADVLPRRPVVLTAHDLLPREPRPGQARAQRRLYDRVDAVVTHSEYGRQLLTGMGVDGAKVHVIHHGAFEHLGSGGRGVGPPPPTALPAELAAPVDAPVVLFFGLLRPYKGLETLLRAWQDVDRPAELWVVGRPMMALEPLRALGSPTVRFVPRFVSDAELAALFHRADLVVLPYSQTERLDQSGVLATALAFGRPSVVSAVGGFPEVAATGAARVVRPDDPAAWREALSELLADPDERGRMAAAAQAAAQGPYSWEAAARATVALYESLAASAG
jgi:glycosyltransferase involved in cell wall biosynthesis